MVETGSSRGRRRIEPPRQGPPRDYGISEPVREPRRPPNDSSGTLSRGPQSVPPGGHPRPRVPESREPSRKHSVSSYLRKPLVVISAIVLGVSVILIFGRGNGREIVTPSSENGLTASIPKPIEDESETSIPPNSETTPPASESTDDTGPEIWDRVAKSVVFVDASQDPECSKSGSGTIIGDGSYILTNEHVAMYDDGSQPCIVSIWIAESIEATPNVGYFTEVVASDRNLDLAILRVVDEFGNPTVVNEAPPINFSNTTPVFGETITVLGYPGLGGTKITLSRGTFAGLDDSEPPFYKTDAMMNSGNSGGGAFNSVGELVGVATAVNFDEKASATAVGLVRPVTDALSLFEQARSVEVRFLEPQIGDEYPAEAYSDTDPRFATCREAKSHGYGPYVSGIDPEYDWYIDRDSDGYVCE